MDRNDLQALARVRLREARVLLASGLSDGAYYLAGYAVECALKACIARKTARYEFPDSARVNACHTHDLSELVKQAGLESALDQQTRDTEFARKWGIVRSWPERCRYQRIHASDAGNMVRAVGDRGLGVLSWLRRYW